MMIEMSAIIALTYDAPCELQSNGMVPVLVIY